MFGLANYINMFHHEGTKKSFSDEFIELIKQGKCKKDLQSVIANKPIHNLIDDNGTHLLHLAAQYNNIELINFLINSGCDLEIEDSSGMTPLTTALTHENFDAVKILHEAYVDKRSKTDAVNNRMYESRKKVQSRLRDDIISLAINQRFSSEKIGQLLVEICVSLMDVVNFHDATVTKTYLELSTADSCDPKKVISRVMSRFDVEHIRVLTSYGLGWELRSYEFFRALLNDISRYSKTEDGKDFLEKVFSWESFVEEHLEYLEKALMTAKRKSVKVFLKYDFHVLARAIYGRDVIACIFGNRNSNVTSLLENNMIDVEGRGYGDNTPLHFAVEGQSIENAKFLLDRGADPNVMNRKQETPLGLAIFRKKDEQMVKLLLLSGANFLVRDKSFEDFEYCHAENVIKVVIAHVAMCEVRGLSIESNLKAYLDLFYHELEEFHGECNKQLNELKNHQIRDTQTTTMFAVVAESLEKFALHVDDEDLQAITTFAEKNTDTLNLYYREAIVKRVEDVERMKICKSKATRIIFDCIGRHDVPQVIVEKIAGYLNFRDLLKLEPYDL